jgi:hypothetical protein
MVFEAWRAGAIQKAFSGGLKLAAPRQTESRVLAFLIRRASGASHTKRLAAE